MIKINKALIYNITALLFIAMNMELRAQESTFHCKSTYQILSDNDDMEESESGVLDLESSDLELVDEFSNQLVGLRYNNIDLPAGTEIVSAHIQFVADELSSDACNLNISGELSGNAPAFENVTRNISSRSRTVSQVQWSPEAWTRVNESSDLQKSNDISSIIQEIVNQGIWSTGNSLVLIISGEGTRTAVSHENNPALAPVLIIETESPSVNVPVKHVFINEIMAKNNKISDEYGESNDWIELYNKNTVPVYLGGVYLSDDVENPTKWQLAKPLTIEAGGFALIWADKDEEQGSLHASFKISSSGETIIISQVLNQEVVEIDRVSFDTIPDDLSYGRKNDGTENWMLLGQPSPNSSNNYSEPGILAPNITLESGIFNEVQFVDIFSETPDARLYYTLDGSIPDSSSVAYTGQIQIGSTSLLKVIAYKNGYAESKLAERFYLFHHASDLPVINISTDPDNLWDDYTGIYVEGKNGTTHHNYPIPSNFFQIWERPAVITMLEPDGSLAFRENAGIALSGNDSKKLIQKSFNLHFRKEYGTKGVDYQVFKDVDLTDFQHLKLRNSGQDFLSLMMRDGLNHTLIQGIIDLDHMAYRPAVLYLNNEYWGLYGLRESLTDDYIDTHYDVKKSEISLLTSGGSIRIENGTDADFIDLNSYIKNHDLAVQDYYNVVEQRIDIDEFINYQITEIFYANYDWPSNNQKLWSAGSDPVWRWMLYDTDASTNYKVWGLCQPYYNSLAHATDASSSSWPNHANSSVIFRGLLQNDNFKYEFAQRMCTYMALVFNQERVYAITDSLVALVDPEIDREIEKWTQDYPNFGIGEACGGSREAWESYVVDYKDFFSQRPEYMKMHMEEKFNLQASYLLRFNYNENTEGTLFVNSNEFKIPHDYTAEYFSGYPLQIKAVAKEGYKFVKWIETEDTSPKIYYIGLEESVLTPVFREIGTAIDEGENTSAYQIKVYPNPVSGANVHIQISGYGYDDSLEMSVYTITGQLVEYRRITPTQDSFIIDLPTTSWKSGIYLLKLQGSSTQKTVKIIIE